MFGRKSPIGIGLLLLSLLIVCTPASAGTIGDEVNNLVPTEVASLYAILHDLYGWVVDNVLGNPDSYIRTDRKDYVAGDGVVIEYNIGDFATNSTDYLYTVSIYRDVNLTSGSHTVTFDGVKKSDTITWNTTGLFNGDYYVVIKRVDRHFPDYSGRYYIPYEYWLVNMTRMSLSGGSDSPGITPEPAREHFP